MRDLGYEGVDEICQLWVDDLSSRPIISGFFKDKSLGSKRFISMPDLGLEFLNACLQTSARLTSSEPLLKVSGVPQHVRIRVGLY